MFHADSCWPLQAWAPPLQEAARELRFNASDGSVVGGVGGDAFAAPTSMQEGREDFTRDPRYADQQLPQTTLVPLRSFTFLRLTPVMSTPAYQVNRVCAAAARNLRTAELHRA